MDNVILQTVPAVRMMLDPCGLKTVRVDLPTTPPLRGTHPQEGNYPLAEGGLFIDTTDLEGIKRKIESFKTEHGAIPGTLRIEGVGTLTVGDAPATGRMRGKIAIVTGAAQGFGEGIARCLANEGANIVVADLNEEAGRKTAESLNAIFVKTNVAEPESLANLMLETVKEFGGLDLFVSNAGVLRAGGLDAMTPEAFDFVTKINYNAYFYCVQAAAPVMKLQNRWAPENYGDIVQINSKSGLRGSKANFAYAGGKFGGIGLTQSFALELAPFRIKVNSVCPGNFYEGPLWSDPDNGLFVQYLAAGKVPGAKTVEDVRQYYMAQVPMGKGTSPEDVTKAIMYLVEQTCETGQALPVTGGQVMLN